MDSNCHGLGSLIYWKKIMWIKTLIFYLQQTLENLRAKQKDGFFFSKRCRFQMTFFWFDGDTNQKVEDIPKCVQNLKWIGIFLANFLTNLNKVYVYDNLFGSIFWDIFSIIVSPFKFSYNTGWETTKPSALRKSCPKRFSKEQICYNFDILVRKRYM